MVTKKIPLHVFLQCYCHPVFAVLKSNVLWDVMPHSLRGLNWQFSRTSCLNLQGTWHHTKKSDTRLATMF